MAALLEVENLAVSFYPAAGEVQAVRGVSFSLRQGEVLAVVGESGCGKSVLCKSIMGLLPDVAWVSLRMMDSSVISESATPLSNGVADGARLTDRAEDPAGLAASAHRPP